MDSNNKYLSRKAAHDFLNLYNIFQIYYDTGKKQADIHMEFLGNLSALIPALPIIHSHGI